MLTKLRGKFITFEGGEGSGKTYFSNLLYEEFKREGIPVIKTFDPGGCELSQKIRKMILNTKNKICTDSELFLFLAARSQLNKDIIKPALKRGITVISDRWTDSTIVYQGFCKGHDFSTLNNLFQYSNICYPDITFLMNVDAKIGLKRSYLTLQKNNLDESKFEDLGLEFHKKVNSHFLYISTKKYHKNNSRWNIIDANKSREFCLREIFRKIDNL